MKKTLLSSFILLLLPFLSFSQTSVSGNIQTNTIWTKTGSPYILIGTVGVPAAYTLTIEPGVTIQRTADYQVLINGAVIINGSQSDSIIFNSGPVITQNNKPFIEFQKSNLNNSSIRFVTFVNESTNGNNIRMGNENEFSQTTPKNSGTLKIARSNLSAGYTATKGYNAGNSMNIDSTIIIAANVFGYYPRSEKINISNSTIISSTVTADAYNYGITFTNCYLKNCRLPLGCCGANLTFTNSKVVDSKIGDGGGTPVVGPVTISNSLFYNTAVNLESATFVVQNSKFIVTKKIYNLDGSEISYLMKVGNISINNCELTNNSGNNYSGMYVSGKAGYAPGNTSTIVNNTFSNVYDALYVKDFEAINPNSNNFKNIGRYHIANYSIKDFSALNNYYGLKPGQTIDNVIFDSNDDLTYGLVNYNPYSTTPLSTAPVSEPENVTKQLSNSSVLVKWKKNMETNIKNYKVYWGYIDEFTYSNMVVVSSADSFLMLNGPVITDSIAVTAVNTSATGTNDQQAGYESWYSPAMLQSSVLPVTLLTFNAINLNNTSVLSWETANEINNDHFDVEFSVDGAIFNKIGIVKGAVNNTYSFVHNTPVVGYNYYRLKQVDKDARFKYSNVVKVKSEVVRRITVYPNPAIATINIVSAVAMVKVSILNELGQPVKIINGSNSLQLKVNIADLPKGVYKIVTINKKQEVDNISLIKQ